MIARRLFYVLILALSLSMPGVRLAEAAGGITTHAYWSFDTGQATSQVRLADLDNDGFREILMASVDDSVYLLQGNGTEVWRYVSDGGPTALLAGTLDPRRGPEAMLGTATGSVDVLDGGKRRWRFAAGARVNALLVVQGADGRANELLAALQNGHLQALDAQGRLLWSYAIDRPIRDLLAADLSGDGRPEIVVVPDGGNEIYALRSDGTLAWQSAIPGGVGLVSKLDLGSPRAGLIVLTAGWELLALDGAGRQLWRSRTPAAGKGQPAPRAGQMAVRPNSSLPGSIALLLPGSDLVLCVLSAAGTSSTGTAAWQRDLGPAPPQSRVDFVEMSAAGNGQWLVVPGSGQASYTVDTANSAVTEYEVAGLTGASTEGDINGDGSDEVIFGTQQGVQAFGLSPRAVWQQVWRSPHLGPISALDMSAAAESQVVVAGLADGRILTLDATGQVLDQAAVGARVGALAIGSPDSRAPVVAAATSSGNGAVAGSAIWLLQGGRALWDRRIDGSVLALAVLRTGQADTAVRDPYQACVVALTQTSTGQQLVGLDDSGAVVWQQRPDSELADLGSSDGVFTAWTRSGQSFALSDDGKPAGLPVTPAGPGLVIPYQQTAVFDVPAGEASQSYQVDSQLQVRVGGPQISLVEHDQALADVQAAAPLSLVAIGNLAGQSPPEILVATQDGYLQLFSLTADQPPLLTNPVVQRTRDGYSYSIDVNDPEVTPVTVTLQIWQPSRASWLTLPTQTLAYGRGVPSWQVTGLFSAWDAGQDARYRFIYQDPVSSGVTAAAVGPLDIQSFWPLNASGPYVARLLVLALIASVGLGTLRLQWWWTYRRTPLGRARTLARRLRRHPRGAVPSIRGLLTGDESDRAVLAHLPALAGEAGLTSIAGLAEGYRLLVDRPNLMREALRDITNALAPRCADDPGAAALLGAYRCCLRSLSALSVRELAAFRADEVRSLPALDREDSYGLRTMMSAFAGLLAVSEILRSAEQVESVEDKVGYLVAATEALARYQVSPRDIQLVDRMVLERVIGHWITVVGDATRALEGNAQIEAVLTTHHALAAPKVTLELQVSNVGRGPAAGVRIELLPGEGYLVAEGQARVARLVTGQLAHCQFVITPLPGHDRLETAFALRFADVMNADNSLVMGGTVRLLQVPHIATGRIPNPYTPGMPLRHNSSVFFGRDEVFQFIQATFVDAPGERVLVLTGDQRMGKTSLLQQLPMRLSRSFSTAYIDSQSLAIDPGTADFFYDLALRISDAVGLPSPRRSDFEAHPSMTFEREFLASAQSAAGGRRLLLLFDEYEELQQRVVNGKLSSEVFPFLRHLMQHSSSLAFIFAGTNALEELDDAYWSSFLSVALHRRIGPLDEGAARALIVRPAQRYLVYDDLAVDKILRVTGRHPYLLQLVCHTLLREANAASRNYVTIGHVNDVLPQVLTLGDTYFLFQWSQFSETEKGILLALARQSAKESVLPGMYRSVPAAGLAPEPDPELEKVVGSLVKREVLLAKGTAPGVRGYVVDLLRLWILQSYAL